MAATVKEQRIAVAEVVEVPRPSPQLIRVLDEVERAAAPREEITKRSRPVIERTPRPYAHD